MSEDVKVGGIYTLEFEDCCVEGFAEMVRVDQIVYDESDEEHDFPSYVLDMMDSDLHISGARVKLESGDR